MATLVDARIGRGRRIIGLELDHGPDDVIGGHAQMRGPVFGDAQNRHDAAAHCPQLLGPAPVEGRLRREEVTEQGERPFGQMGHYDGNDTPRPR